MRVCSGMKQFCKEHFPRLRNGSFNVPGRLYRIADMQTDTNTHTHTSLHAHTNNFYHIITVQSHTPFIFPLLRVTGSKIWFPPHNSLYNAISPALNCQDNLYQSRGESPESLSGYSSARQEKQEGGGGGNRYFPSGTAADTSAASPSHLDRRQVVKKCLEEMETDKWRIRIILLPGARSRTFSFFVWGDLDICQVSLCVCVCV